MATRDASRVKGLGLADVLYVARHPKLQKLSVPYLTQCAGLVRESYVFSLLTVNERTSRAENAMLAWRLAGMPEDAPTIRTVCGPWSPLAGTSNGPSNKADCIAGFLADYNSDPLSFIPSPGEPANIYRDRVLSIRVKGLALTKTTWAAQLVTGGGNIACLDRHMMRLLLGRQVTQDELNTRKPKTIKLYRRLEKIMVLLAERYGWHSASALQWSVWAHSLAQTVTHDVVWGSLDTLQFREDKYESIAA